MIHWLQTLLANYGDWVVGLVLFLNNIGVPVPGDTVLLASGFFAEKGHLSLWTTLFSGTAGCFMGANGGYWIGKRFGHPLLKKMNWLKLKPGKMEKIENFFIQYGAKAVFFARFVAVLHPITGLLAGMGLTPWRDFLFYNLAGSAAYVTLYVFAGYYFGERWGLVKLWIGDIALYLLLVIAILITAFIGLLLWRIMRDSFHRSPFRKP